MALYRIDVVCFNCKQLNPQQRSKSNIQEHCSPGAHRRGVEWVDDPLGLAVAESSLLGQTQQIEMELKQIPNLLCMHLRVSVAFSYSLVTDFLCKLIIKKRKYF